MEIFQTLIILIFLAAILVGIAQKLHVPYPLILIFGGVGIGFIPGLEAITFDPNLLLLIVLPPILYYAAFAISFREFKKNIREILSLALGLVLITTLVVGVVFKSLFPELSWPLAFAFGAIVSPPDSVAATTILKRFSIRPKLLAILEGESLINDASALVLYRIAVVAILSGAFSFADASLQFIKIVSGGTVIGLLSGVLLQSFSRRYLDPVPGVLFSFTIPYVTYITAHFFGVSEVLAVVINGLIGSRFLAMHHSPLRRVIGFTFWDIFVILMNCFVFILIGLQLRHFVIEMSTEQLLIYIAYSLLITFILLAIRMVWVYAKSGFAYIKALRNPKKCDQCPEILRESVIISWSGMRGIVSLTVALALPYTDLQGMPVEGRGIVIFMTFVVILVTIVVPSTTLPYLIGVLKISYHENHHEAHDIRKKLAKAAEDHIHKLHKEESINDREVNFLLNYFNLQRYTYEISTSHLKRFWNLEVARLQVFKAQREELLAMWKRQEIADELFQQLEHELDVQESHVARAELK